MLLYAPMADEELKPFLQGVAAFGGLEGPSLERVVGMLAMIDLAPGNVACAEGEQGKTMYVIRSGEVEVSRISATGRRVPIVRLGPGECFGEMTLLEIKPRSATIIATMPTRIYGLTKADLFRLYLEDVQAYVLILQNLCRELARRLRKADSRIADFIDRLEEAEAELKDRAVSR